jgi:hypothetical protein
MWVSEIHLNQIAFDFNHGIHVISGLEGMMGKNRLDKKNAGTNKQASDQFHAGVP